MDFSNFVIKAVEQDKRNTFSKYHGNLDGVPEILRPFYLEHNPIYVEVESDGVGVRFYPAKGLASLQREYAYLKGAFIFATYNGDPVFFHGGKVYTCPHGVENPEWELLSANMESYWDSLFS